MENQSDFYASLIRATKNYVGNDPLLPWLEGIKKIKEVLQPEVAQQKLPRFIEKCAQTFLTDKRYKNDLRYLQVWIQLLEFVPNRREALLVMENNKIGLRHALYYQAYALHYEKLKKFPEADAMFRLGIQRFAHPTESLHRSYDAFLERMASRNRRKLKSLQARAELPSKNIHSLRNGHFVGHADVGIKEVQNEMEVYPKGEYQFSDNSSLNHQAEICNNVERSHPTYSIAESASHSNSSTKCKNDCVECSRSWSPETLEHRSIVVSSDKSTSHGHICDEVFIKSGSLLDRTNLLPMEDGEPNKEKVTSEGLNNVSELETVVEPRATLVSNSHCEDTINICENLDCAVFGSTKDVEDASWSQHIDKLSENSPSKKTNSTMPAVKIIQILPDENLEDQALIQQPGISSEFKENNSSVPAEKRSGDSVSANGFKKLSDQCFEDNQQQKPIEGNISKDDSSTSMPVDVFQESSIGDGELNKECRMAVGKKNQRHLGEGSYPIASFPSKSFSEDTIIVRKFVDSAIVHYTEKVEDAYHHGLVEPTINTKEAMADINDMFGKPLNFVKSRTGNEPWRKQTNNPIESFQVLVDEDLKEPSSTEQCILSDTVDGHTSFSPSSKGLKVFVDEDLIHSSSEEVPSMTNSSKNLAPVNGLQILADSSFNDNQKVIFMQRNTCEDGELSTVAEIFQGGLSTEEIWDKSRSNSERKKGHGQLGNAEEVSMHSKFSSEDTIAIRKFVDSAIDGDSKELEVACHHGLVDPTINTKEAMEEINNMFWKPLQFDKIKQRNQPSRAEIAKQPTETFQIYADENMEEQDSSISSFKDFEVFIDENLMNDSLKELPRKLSSSMNLTPFQGLQILSDESFENKISKECNTFKDKEPYTPVEVFQDRQVSPTVSLPPNFSSEDTMIIRKFVDSAIVGTEVEDACHHGLVDPTINTKEAMAEINDMFGKPLHFHNKKRSCCTLRPETITKPVKSSPISANEDIEKQGLKQQHHLHDNLEEHDSVIPLDKGFQIFIDEDVYCKSTKNDTKKSCLSGDIACGPILTNEHSVVLQEKASVECIVSENENVCKPDEGFQVYIDEQFQD